MRALAVTTHCNNDDSSAFTALAAITEYKCRFQHMLYNQTTVSLNGPICVSCPAYDT
jgi:hypothetical protein